LPPDTTPAPAATGPPRLPVTIVAGFLGSGKTTLVNQILAQQTGLRVAVMVNELGDIAIDGELIETGGDDIVELANGCICCSIAGDFATAVARVLRRRAVLDYLVVEATGLADPLPVALALLRPEFRDAVRVDAIVTVADAENLSLDLAAGKAALHQLRYADFVLLNKCDLVVPVQADLVEAKIRAVAERARIVRTVRAEIPVALILDAGLFDPGRALAGAPHDHLIGDGFEAVSFASDRAFLVDAFQAFLEALPPKVFRAKGILAIAESGQQYLFQLVGRRFTLDEAPVRSGPGSRLVLIGRDLDALDLRARLQACLAGPLLWRRDNHGRAGQSGGHPDRQPIDEHPPAA
jgi:G3E family GTPase